MPNPSAPRRIRLRGVRQNNLKNLDLDLPLGQLVVVTGLSGSGKSSLAFDTLFAEGQRRYIETFSPYARQFLDRMDKPRADRIDGIPPSIAIEQRNAVRTTRSTVGTLTEICDYLKVVWPHLSKLHCRQCGQPVHQDAPAGVWARLQSVAAHGQELWVTFDLPVGEKLALAECLTLIGRQGYQRLLVNGQPVGLDEAAGLFRGRAPATLVVLQDRLALRPALRRRVVEACEQAYHFGKGRLAVYLVETSAGDARPARATRHPFSNRLHCAACDLEYSDPSPALFSFNHPLGACLACRGFGRIISIDYDRALPDRGKTLAQGAVKPWCSGVSAECQADLLKFCARRGVPTDVPFRDLEPRWQTWVIEGDAGYGSDPAHEWPHAWYGIKGYFRWLESKAYKMHYRVLLSRYRAYHRCPDCQGRRLQPDALLHRLSLPDRTLTLADFYALTIDDALGVADTVLARRARSPNAQPGAAAASDPLALALEEVRARLGYLVEVGVGYLTLDRPTRTLSGGETERVNLTTCLGSRLVNTLFVLDEPTVGLHPRDTARLVRILRRLRDAGNSVVVVEHEPLVMRAADRLLDLGPGHGEAGGHLVFEGSFRQLLKSRASLTGQYLSGRRRMDPPPRRPVDLSGASPRLVLRHATQHNVRDLEVQIPLGRLVCVTGVSGSGKTTLVRELLWPALVQRLASAPEATPPEAGGDREPAPGEDPEREATPPPKALLEGAEHIARAIFVDQALLSRTPRSNPAVYVGAFESLRELFAQSEPARQRGLGASAFSFNSIQGQCEHCRGAGFEKVEMQFLSDVFLRCPACDGRRYRPHILEITLEGPGRDATPVSKANGRAQPRTQPRTGPWNIADLLDASVEQALTFLAAYAHRPAGRRAAAQLALLAEVGLGYLRLGQPLNTLSGGESQRLRLVRQLAELAEPAAAPSSPWLFLFDEPTTGLHFEDVRVLLGVFQRMVERGHSVLVVEHNTDVVRAADWVIDLGPEAGAHGGRLVVAGTPETVAACDASHTGRALRDDRPR